MYNVPSAKLYWEYVGRVPLPPLNFMDLPFPRRYPVKVILLQDGTIYLYYLQELDIIRKSSLYVLASVLLAFLAQMDYLGTHPTLSTQVD